MRRQNVQRRARRIEKVGPLQQRCPAVDRYIGGEFPRQPRIVGRQRRSRAILRQGRRQQALSAAPSECIGALRGRLLRKNPARERGVGKPLRILRGQACFEPVAHQDRINDIGGARQKPVPAAALREACQPIPPQAVRHGLSGMCAQESIDRRVEIFVRAQQVAPQPGCDQIVVDGVMLQGR